MIKSILICTDGSSSSITAAAYAIDLASKLQARLRGLHVVDSRVLEGPLMADISGWIGAQPYGNQLQQFRELLEKKGESIIDAFLKQCEEAGIQAETSILMGHPSNVILDEEQHTELVILGLRGEHAEWAGDMPGSNVERIIRRSSRPVLVVPDAAPAPGKILAAYDSSPSATRALHEAIDMTKTLHASLSIVTATEGIEEGRADQVAEDAVQLAADHGCEASASVQEGLATDAVLDISEKENSSLIITGAYGHSRIRELILGSTTSQLIAKSGRPVLMVR